MSKNPFRYFKTSAEIIRLAVMTYIRFPLSLRNVEDLLYERGIYVTDKLSFYKSALYKLGAADRQETGRWLNNRAENSHQPLRRREKIMTRFRQMLSLQKFAAAHASVHIHLNLDRSLERRSNFKDIRQAALTEWRELLAA